MYSSIADYVACAVVAGARVADETPVDAAARPHSRPRSQPRSQRQLSWTRRDTPRARLQQARVVDNAIVDAAARLCSRPGSRPCLRPCSRPRSWMQRTGTRVQRCSNQTNQPLVGPSRARRAVRKIGILGASRGVESSRVEILDSRLAVRDSTQLEQLGVGARAAPRAARQRAVPAAAD